MKYRYRIEYAIRRVTVMYHAFTYDDAVEIAKGIYQREPEVQEIKIIDTEENKVYKSHR